MKGTKSTSEELTRILAEQKEGGYRPTKDPVHTPYTRECFDGLEMRFEEPHSNSRWDSPLFVVYPGDELDFDGIYNALYTRKPLVPNRSTENVIYQLSIIKSMNSFIYLCL